ncbi:MAG: hypothetical protein IIB27_08770, partial [Chloroflexi bacterium]|nr:hypothetical protein [Chloroflexota bacterium]
MMLALLSATRSRAFMALGLAILLLVAAGAVNGIGNASASGDHDDDHDDDHGNKVQVVGDPAFTTPVHILATNKSNPNDSHARVWFDG